MPGTAGIPTAGERDMVRWLGEGVGIGEPDSEYSPASDRADRPGMVWLRDASAAAVAAAASSTVPV